MNECFVGKSECFSFIRQNRYRKYKRKDKHKYKKARKIKKYKKTQKIYFLNHKRRNNESEEKHRIYKIQLVVKNQIEI